MRIKSVNAQLNEERKKNALLANALYKAKADLEYVAMMTDVDLGDDEPEEVNENE